MNNKQLNSPTNRISNKIRFSLVWKLNVRLFFRMLAIFLMFDTALCLMSTAGLVLRAEYTVAAVAEMLSQTGLPTPEAKSWLELAGCSVTLQTEEAHGLTLPKPLQHYFSQQTSGTRSINLPTSESLTPWEKLGSVTYNVTANDGGQSYQIAIRLQEPLRIFGYMFAILFILELILLLSYIFSGARIIRNALRPIEELAQTAQNLNTNADLTPEQLEVLAGKLDDINATKLDTRIPVDDTQSELKTLAFAINGLLDRINESYRSQVRFVSDASHELRTPISVIQGYANLLDRWGKNDQKTLQESIDAIKEETANMKSLVEQLLFLARGDNNTMSLQIKHIELSILAEEVLRETQMIDSNHTYYSHFSPIFINADKSLIKQAMRILIDNAMKFTPAGKRITISVSGVNGFARLTIQDEGIGISPEAVPKIFDRFFRADESRARATGGTGLGLSIAKWITERHGGHIEVLSRQNIGTRISIFLPASSGEKIYETDCQLLHKVK